jgi:competence protein ComEA
MEGWYFSRQQKVGALVLMCLLSLVILAWWGWQQVRPESELDFALADSLYVAPTSTALGERVDINLADSTEWEALPGIGPRLAQRILRYRKSLGGFDSVAQVRKVYGLRPETWERIQPQLFVNALTRPKAAPKVQHTSREIPRLEINRASAEEFAQLPGIGSVLSQRIVNFRQAKGGYASVAEIAEVYRLEAETFQRIRPYL